jgi:spermidine synthase
VFNRKRALQCFGGRGGKTAQMISAIGLWMSVYFEELDYRPTSMGVLTLRRRKHLTQAVDIYEIKLGDEFLMSSMFTASEIAMARLGLAELSGQGLNVVVGGLGLGYTAEAVLENARVGSLVVVDALAEVIEWHERGLIPLGAKLMADGRCRFVHGDFFAMSSSTEGFDPAHVQRRFDAILVDIDHSPRNFLHPSHASLYGAEGLGKVASHLRAGGVFALWSNDPPDDAFTRILSDAFAAADAHIVTSTTHYRIESRPTQSMSRRKVQLLDAPPPKLTRSLRLRPGCLF